jgi:integrase
MPLLMFLTEKNIDLYALLRDGKGLTGGEVEELLNFVKKPMASLVNILKEREKRTSEVKRPRTVPQSRIGWSEYANVANWPIRAFYVTNFLDWLFANYRATDNQNKILAIAARKETIEALKARTPVKQGRNVVGRREALEPEIATRLVKAIQPGSDENPWSNEFSQVRNRLLVTLLYDFGLRRGELLGIQIKDINFRTNVIGIYRKADNPEDPRLNQPNAKTLDRELPMSDRLAKGIQEYIVQHGRGSKNASRHDFLFTAKGGRPLSLRACNEVFLEMRQRLPWLPDSFSPHIFRHTSNENLSNHFDENGVDEETELSIRSFAMGWKDGSPSAKYYIGRKIRRKANEALLKLQKEQGEKIGRN